MKLSFVFPTRYNIFRIFRPVKMPRYFTNKFCRGNCFSMFDHASHTPMVLWFPSGCNRCRVFDPFLFFKVLHPFWRKIRSTLWFVVWVSSLVRYVVIGVPVAVECAEPAGSVCCLWYGNVTHMKVVFD